MAHNYNSEIDRFFTIKYDKNNGQRISGKCQFCPNSVITAQYTANYWKHLKEHHPSMYREYHSAQNNNINNNTNNNANNHHDDDNDNHDYHDNKEMDCDEIVERLSEPSMQLENETFNNKRARIGEIKQTKLEYPSTPNSKIVQFQQFTAEIFAKLGLPHKLIRNKEFRQFLAEFEKLKCSETLKLNFASRAQHRRYILSSAAELFNGIIKTLQDNNCFITLAIDGWTGQRYGAKNTNIIALCKGKSYLLWSDRNSDEIDGTDNYLFPLIKGKIEFLMSKHIAVCAITTDNAQNMLNVGKELYKLPNSGPVILHLSCSAHTIQLMLKDIVLMEPINTTIDAALAIIEPFLAKGGKRLRLELRKAQISAGKNPLKLIIFNSTRWLSRFETIKRLIQLKSHIIWVAISCNLPNLAVIQQDSFWNKLEKLILPFLNAFKQATNMVQQDSATLLTLDKALAGIRTAVNNAAISQNLNVPEQAEIRYKFNANALINQRMQEFVLASGYHYAFWAVSLLTDKPLMQWQSSWGDSNKDYKETHNWIANWGADITLFYPSHFQIKCSRDKPTIVSTIKRQIAEFEAGIASFSNKQEYMNDYTVHIPKNSIDFDPENPEKREINWTLFWFKMKRFEPELSSVAVCLLSLGISEASCERSFSVQQLTHSKVRNRLNSDIVEAEMVIRFNKSAFDDYETEEEASDSD